MGKTLIANMMSRSRFFVVALCLALAVHGLPFIDTVVPEIENGLPSVDTESAEAAIPKQPGCFNTGGDVTVNLPGRAGGPVMSLTSATSCTITKYCTEIPSCKRNLEIGGGNCDGAQITMTFDGWNYDNNPEMQKLLHLPKGCRPCPDAKPKSDPNAAAIMCVISGKAFTPAIDGLKKGVDGVATGAKLTGQAIKDWGEKVGDGAVTGADKIAAVSKIIADSTAGVAVRHRKA